MNNVLWSHKSCEWSTPQELFNQLDAEFHFDIDVCATDENAKCQNYYTIKDNGLLKPWAGTVWCNPPYGRAVGQWVRKASLAAASGSTVVMLLPARTDTKWFHEYIYGRAEIRFVRGRIKFGGSKNAAPFPSMVVIFGRFRPREGRGM